MLIISNRSQRITYSEIKDHLEKATRAAVSNEILLELSSVDPESYKFMRQIKQYVFYLCPSKNP